jgi:hypothetical protein
MGPEINYAYRPDPSDWPVGDAQCVTAKEIRERNAAFIAGTIPPAEARPVYCAQDGSCSCAKFQADPARCDRRPPSVAGRKDDSGKLDMSLLEDVPRALEGIVEVMQWAITKKQPTPYERGSWQYVDSFKQRYMAAMRRHISKRDKARLGEGDRFEPLDAETNLMELKHIATNAIFLLEMAMREEEQ